MRKMHAEFAGSAEPPWIYLRILCALRDLSALCVRCSTGSALTELVELSLGFSHER